MKGPHIEPSGLRELLGQPLPKNVRGLDIEGQGQYLGGRIHPIINEVLYLLDQIVGLASAGSSQYYTRTLIFVDRTR